MSKKPARSPVTASDRSRSPAASDRVRLEIEFEKVYLLGALFGEHDQNLITLEGQLGVYISARGNKVQIEGEADAAARARDVLTSLYNRLSHGEKIDTGDVVGTVAIAADPSLDGLVSAEGGMAQTAVIRTRRKTIAARSPTQVRYIEALARDSIIFALGPAGTGKTYLAVAQAVSQLIAGSVDRLILS
ncbi:MAG: PhoH family protein, partial [Sandarakinorhabdus sp.]|nr:PhoH family protein [Sandarakinorhabdus sp.]